MICSWTSLSPQVRALLTRERDIAPLPAAVRARALARARAAIAAGLPSAPAPVRPAARMRWASCVVLSCLASALVGATAYQVYSRLRAESSEGFEAPVEMAARVDVRAPNATSRTCVTAAHTRATGEPVVDPKVASPKPRLSPPDAMRTELRLVRHSRAAVARGDY